jgi:hypothetical protein
LVSGELNTSKLPARAGALQGNACGTITLPDFLYRRRCLMDQKPYPAEKARGGEIILNTPGRRAIFLTGLIGAVVLAVVLMIVR